MFVRTKMILPQLNIAENWRRALSEMETRTRELHRELQSSFAQSVDETVRSHLDTIIQSEIRNSVLPR